MLTILPFVCWDPLIVNPIALTFSQSSSIAIIYFDFPGCRHFEHWRVLVPVPVATFDKLNSNERVGPGIENKTRQHPQW